jgi:hypothetical protein
LPGKKALPRRQFSVTCRGRGAKTLASFLLNPHWQFLLMKGWQMTLPISTTSTTAAQAYQAICAAANSATSNTSQPGTPNAAFSVAGGADPLAGTNASGSTLNSSLLNALLGISSAGTPHAAAANSATTAPDRGASTAPSAAHQHHGISAYIAQLASTASAATT